MYYKFKNIDKNTEDAWYSLSLDLREKLGILCHGDMYSITHSLLQYSNSIHRVFYVNSINITPRLLCYMLACVCWFNVLRLPVDYNALFKITPTSIMLSWERRPIALYL